MSSTELTISPEAFSLALPEFFAQVVEFAGRLDAETARDGQAEAALRANLERQHHNEDQARRWSVAAVVMARRVAESLPGVSLDGQTLDDGLTNDQRGRYRTLAKVGPEAFQAYVTTHPAPSFTGAWKLGRPPREPTPTPAATPRAPKPTISQSTWAEDLVRGFEPAPQGVCDTAGFDMLIASAADEARVACDNLVRLASEHQGSETVHAEAQLAAYVLCGVVSLVGVSEGA